MSRKQTDPTAYLVEWPEHLVIKGGVSDLRRWESFLARGGRLVHRTTDPDFRMIMEIERDVLTVLRSKLPYAFDTKAEAVDLLGGSGGGFLECFRASSAEQLSDARDACSSIMLRASKPGAAQSICTDGRTNEQTKTAGHLADKSSTTDTCAHVQDSTR